MIGLDFGTSNSATGIIIDNKPQLVPLEDAKLDMPTAMFFDFDNNQTLFGRKALDEYVEGEYGRFMRSLKSALGTSLMIEKTFIKSKAYTFVEIISCYIEELKKRSEKYANKELNNVVIGRPVNFIDDDISRDSMAEKSLFNAAKKAGFENIEFEFEPIAAALSYETTIDKEELALIIDIGGGTADFSVIRVSPIRSEKLDRKNDILSTSGIHIGGTDFDKLISLEKAMPFLGYKQLYKNSEHMELPKKYFHDLATWHRINYLYDKDNLINIKKLETQVENKATIQRFIQVIEDKELHHIAIEVEKSKIELTNNKQTTIDLSFIEKNLHANLTQDNFNDFSQETCNKIKLTMEDALIKARVKPQHISAIFLTGGTTSLTNLRELLLQPFNNAKIVNGDKFGSIATGLTLKSQKIFM